MLTKEAIAFAQLGRLAREFANFKESNQVTDAEELADITAALQIGKQKRITKLVGVTVDEDGTYSGEFQQYISPRLTKRFTFVFGEDEISFKPINAEQITKFSEDVEDFARQSKSGKAGKALNCKIEQCGGRCLKGGETCRTTPTPEQKKLWASASGKNLATKQDTSLAKKRRETAEKKRNDRLGITSIKKTIEEGKKTVDDMRIVGKRLERKFKELADKEGTSSKGSTGNVRSLDVKRASKNKNNFAEGDAVTDPAILREVQTLLSQKTGNLRKISQLFFDGDETDFTITGKAEQAIGSIRSQSYSFTITPDGITYKLTNAAAATEFAETPEFAGFRKKSKLRCNPGNIQCGGKCQNGKMNCNEQHSPEQKKGWAGIAQKIANFFGRFKPRKSKTPKEPGGVSHKDLINNGAKVMPKALKGELDNLRSLSTQADTLRSKIKKMPKGAERDKLIEQHQGLKKSVEEAEGKAVASMGDFRKSLIDQASVEDKKAAKKFAQGLSAGDLDKDLRKEVIGQAREFGALTGGKGASTLKYIVQTAERPHADQRQREVNVGDNPAKTTNFHEFAHHIEYENPKLGRAALEWVKERSTSGKTQSLNRLTKSSDYDKDEVAYPDKFVEAYVGKVYKEKGKELPYTEVISMGVERFSSPEAMVKFHTKDPEHFNFTLGVLKHRES